MENEPLKLFGGGRDEVSAPAEGEAPKRKRTRVSRGMQGAISLFVLLAVLAACFEIYRRATNYGTRVVQAHPVDARIEIVNPPAWLDRRIVSSLLDEAYQFAQRDQATYDRARNILDGDVLREIGDLYVGTERVEGKNFSRQRLGFNAWISGVKEVHRELAKGKAEQTIQIIPEWREPAAWVRVAGEEGPLLCLIDANGVRLPGDYHPEDRGNSPYMEIAGVDLPVLDGTARAPEPGERWSGKFGIARDLAAGMQLADMLKHKVFARQINAIDMSNFEGRKDARASWVVLETVWQTDAVAPAVPHPHVVNWGRSIGEEKFYNISAAEKIKALNALYERYGRIDAGQEYVDIWPDVPRIPRVTPVPELASVTQAHG